MKKTKRIELKIVFLAFLLLIEFANVRAQISSGGSFRLMQSVVADGGNKSSGGYFTLEGTIAQQAIVVRKNNNVPFVIDNGFWTSDFNRPTAAGLSIGGRVLTARRRGLRGALVTLVGGADGNQTRIVYTSLNGRFQFNDVEIGYPYFLKVEKNNFTFTPPNEVFFLQDSRSDFIFIMAQ